MGRPIAVVFLMIALMFCTTCSKHGPRPVATPPDNSTSAPESQTAVRKYGGFRCVDLRSIRNDSTFNLYEVGNYAVSAFSQDVFKRNGVPFWYPPKTGDIRVAGPEWTPDAGFFDGRAFGAAHADRQMADSRGAGAAGGASDGDRDTYWYAGDDAPGGNLWVEFYKPAVVSRVAFLASDIPPHAPKDYAVGLIFPDGSRKEIARVRDEKRLGGWLAFECAPTQAQGIYLNVFSTVEGKHGPIIHEFRPQERNACPAEVIVPLHGIAAEELFCLGHVGSGFDATPDVETPVGEYVLRYENGKAEQIPLIAGRNVADIRYGHFVPEAEFFLGFKGGDVFTPEETAQGYYHLDEMLQVEPRKQIMFFSHAIGDPRAKLESLTFRCTHPRAYLVLAGLTLRQSGPRINALNFAGRTVRPYPESTLKAEPSLVTSLLPKDRALSLDGDWQYVMDPGNRGRRHGYFAVDFDTRGWKTMPVPSQWYVEGHDYHGVVWYRREFDMPASFPGSVFELDFGGVDYDARVWVNGQYVGRHVGAYSSFNLDVTGAIRKGARNLIVVRVDSPIDPGFEPSKTLAKGNSMDDIAMPYNEEGCQGGIFRSVVLRGRGDIGIKNVWTSTTLSDDLKHVRVAVKMDLNPARDAAGDVRVVCRLSEPVGAKRQFETEKTVAITSPTPVELAFDIDDPVLWYPWEQGQPHLHTMEIEAWRNGELLDRNVSRVGLREVQMNRKEHCLYVNRHRIFIKGMLNDDVHWMSMMDRTGYRQRVQLQKDANLNLIRMVGHQSSPEMYDLCDEMGMMIWQEMPLQWLHSTAEPIRKDILGIVEETVTQTRAHASVVGWSAWNEGGQTGFSEAITRTIQRLDGTRPMTSVSGGSDFDIHIYPNILPRQLSCRTFFWTGIHVGFVSEVGAYGLSSLEEMKEIVGEDLFLFGSAEYYWETFNSYRHEDGPVFLDLPVSADWPADRISDYVSQRVAPSERWLEQFMKFMFENFRAQRFAPTTSAIHCRFDDPMPTAFMGTVNFNGRPRKAYYSVKESCQQVLPILYFGFRGAEDIRVVNEYWSREWRGCTLRYTLSDRHGKVLIRKEKRFDLPPDSTVAVISGDEAGDLYHIPGGFRAELEVLDGDGRTLSRNHYDLAGKEIKAFLTSVYPVPPVRPLDAVVIMAPDIAARGAATRVAADATYSPALLEIGGGEEPAILKTPVSVPKDGEYLVRVACDSGKALRSCDLRVDGIKANLEYYPYFDFSLGMTRRPYSERKLSWYPGWRVRLTRGNHSLELNRPGKGQARPLCIDAIAVQPTD